MSVTPAPARLDPKAEYEQRLAARREVLGAAERLDARVANARLLVFLGGVALALAAWQADGWPWWPALAAGGVFVVLVVLHDVVLRRKRRAADAVAYYEAALARLAGSWAGQGIAGDGLAPKDHPFAADLDLFGAGSLFERLCTCRTRAGEATLAGWLLGPSPAAEVQTRQRAVDELRGRLDLREDLALLGGPVRARVEPGILTRWGEAPAVFPPDRRTLVVRGLAAVLAAAAVLACAAWGATDLGPGPLIAVALVEAVVLRVLRDRLTAVTTGIEEPSRELEVLATVLRRVATEPFASDHLRRLQRALGAGGAGAAIQIARLERLVTWLDSQRNQAFGIIAFFLQWSVHFSVAIDSWRQRSGPHIRGWLGALAELEALAALGGYAFEHPDDPFPEVVAEGPMFEAEALGHPLLPPDGCVRNSVALHPGPSTGAADAAGGDPAGGGAAPLWIVSGSNMSGKSTLLRAVGVNAVLAMAGAPVRARALRLSPLQLGATLRVLDSLADGKSRFYAEIARLRQIVDLCGAGTPVLFLLDEILHGTNSHDRQIGAEAVVRSLIGAGAIGLVTTHDLALTRVAGALGGGNVHFADELIDGRLSFDYRLRPGVVEKSNALDLMRAVGLRV